MDYMLLEIQDKVKIDGESTLKGFEKFIEVMSYSTGVAIQVMPTTSNAKRTNGRPNIQDLTVTKVLDATTPLLVFNCVSAKDLGTTRLHIARQDAAGSDAGSQAIDYMIYEMSDTIISSVSDGGGGGGEPTETLSLSFNKLTWTYTPQKEVTGAAGKITHSWDQSTNTGS